jgi:hypothetical protein
MLTATLREPPRQPHSLIPQLMEKVPRGKNLRKMWKESLRPLIKTLGDANEVAYNLREFESRHGEIIKVKDKR